MRKGSRHLTRWSSVTSFIFLSIASCARSSGSDSNPGSPQPSRPPTASALVPPPPATSADVAPHTKLDADSAERVMQSVNRLALIDRACKKRVCSLTVDSDGGRWLVAVGSDRSPAPLTPLHLFTVVVEASSEQAVAVLPGGMYGGASCHEPIPLKDWDRYSAQYERFLDGRGSEPSCPSKHQQP
jgi:hypothetical protein